MFALKGIDTFFQLFPYKKYPFKKLLENFLKLSHAIEFKLKIIQNEGEYVDKKGFPT